MRIFLTKTFLALAITTVAAFGADNTIGTWKLNVEKSKYTPAPMPLKSLTVTREASDGGVKVTATGELTDGTAAFLRRLQTPQPINGRPCSPNLSPCSMARTQCS